MYTMHAHPNCGTIEISAIMHMFALESEHNYKSIPTTKHTHTFMNELKFNLYLLYNIKFISKNTLKFHFDEYEEINNNIYM